MKRFKNFKTCNFLLFILQSIYLTNLSSHLKSSLQTMNNRSLFRFVISICLFVREMYYIRKMKDNPNVGISVSRKDFNCSQDFNLVSAFSLHWSKKPLDGNTRFAFSTIVFSLLRRLISSPATAKPLCSHLIILLPTAHRFTLPFSIFSRALGPS